MLCEHANGPPPSPEHQAAHSCGRGRQGCVNPQHLRWATYIENQADIIKHGTWGKKLTEEIAREMLGLKGLLSVNEISERFGISPSSVYDLFKGTTWKHLHAD
jgi:AraC-like DNA-binding protein